MSKEKEAYFKSLPQLERITALKENAVTAYQKNVIRDFSEDELTDMKSTLSDVDIMINDLEIEKKNITGEVNGKIKIQKAKHQELLRDLKNKWYENTEEVYDIDNQEEGTMSTFDAHGNLIGTRRLTPKEKQTSIKHLIAKAS